MCESISEKQPKLPQNDPNTQLEIEELLTRQEVASILKVKENTLAVWACKGTGPAPIKIGACVRYSRSSIEQYIQKNTIPR